MHRLTVPLEIKSAADASGTFEGYGAVFNNIDSDRDIIVPGAFARTIAEKAGKGRSIPILWQHDHRAPIGVVSDIREDERGLFFSAKLQTKSGRGAEAYDLLQIGALTGISIGYQTKDSEVDRKTGIRRLKEVNLMELSLVTFPANDEARVSGVKSAPTTLREFEAFLREEGGFSGGEAVTIAKRGFLALDSQREAAKEALSHSIANLIKTLKG